MACLDHNCVVCGWWDASNERVHVCPRCGGRVHTTFDETPTQRQREVEEAEFDPPDEDEEFDAEDFDLTDDAEDGDDED